MLDNFDVCTYFSTCQLNAEIAECEELRESELPSIEEKKSHNKELHQTVLGLNKHQMSLKTSLKQLKERCKEIDDKVCLLA